MNVRRLAPGDEEVVLALATREPPSRAPELLADDRTLFLVAFDGERPVGFVLAYELVRRHGRPSMLFVYEVEVAAAWRRAGVATALLHELERIAASRGIREGFVLTSKDNEPAMRLYASVGGVGPHEELMWEFEYWER